MTTWEGLTAWDVNRLTKPKVQYTVTVLMGNTSKIIWTFTFNYIDDRQVQTQMYNE